MIDLNVLVRGTYSTYGIYISSYLIRIFSPCQSLPVLSFRALYGTRYPYSGPRGPEPQHYCIDGRPHRQDAGTGYTTVLTLPMNGRPSQLKCLRRKADKALRHFGPMWRAGSRYGAESRA